MWRYLILCLLAVSLVRADDVILFANGGVVPISDAQILIYDTIFTVDAINPVNGSIIDRDSFDGIDADVIALVASLPIEFPDGVSVTFFANLTQPSSIVQSNIVLGYNNSSSGIATLYYNPNATTYAGNWTWFARASNAITNEARNVLVKGSATMTFSDAASDPNATYFQSQLARTRVNLTSNGPETPTQLDVDYNALVNAQITNSTGSTALTSLPFVGGLWDASYALLTLKGVGIWNDTTLSAIDFFYTPTSSYREFTVFGYMNVTASSTVPSSISSFSETTTTCTVLDQDTNYAVPDANVSFFRNGIAIGSNLTALNGSTTFTFQVNATGTSTITCSVTDQATIYYAAGSEPSRNSTVSVLNQGPVFADGIDDASDATNVTNEGELVTFTTSANDPEGDDWFILVCATPGVSGGNCTGAEYCRSGATTSGSPASCSVNTTGLSNENNFWWAYPCDINNDCGVTVNTTSPFVVNHAPYANPFITPGSPTVLQNATCNLNATDNDSGDTISATYAWWQRDEGLGPWDLVIGESGVELPASTYDSNDEIICTATPTDIHGFTGAAANSSAISIAKGNLSASAALSAPNVTNYYSVTLSVSCTVTTGDAEDVTVIIEDDHTGSFAQSSTASADVSVNVSSILLGRIASGSSATHQVRILGEVSGVYNFRARCTATDTTPTSASSAAQTLTVIADTTAPVISSVSGTVTNQTFTITWTTDDLSDSTISYGLTSSLGASVYDPTITTTHSVQVTGLEPTTDYYYNLTSCNGDGVCGTAGLYSIRTDGPEEALPNEKGVFTGVFVERGPSAPAGSIAKGDVFEMYMEVPQGLDSQEEAIITIIVKGKEIRKRITLPYTVKSPVTVIYP